MRDICDFLRRSGRMLTGYLVPTSGRIEIAGHDVVEDSLGVRRAISYVPEDAPLYDHMMALPHLSSSDLIAALPRRLVERHAARFALAAVELPLKRKSDLIQAVATKAAIMDAGIGWLMQQIGEGG